MADLIIGAIDPDAPALEQTRLIIEPAPSSVLDGWRRTVERAMADVELGRTVSLLRMSDARNAFLLLVRRAEESDGYRRERDEARQELQDKLAQLRKDRDYWKMRAEVSEGAAEDEDDEVGPHYHCDQRNQELERQVEKLRIRNADVEGHVAIMRDRQAPLERELANVRAQLKPKDDLLEELRAQLEGLSNVDHVKLKELRAELEQKERLLRQEEDRAVTACNRIDVLRAELATAREASVAADQERDMWHERYQAAAAERTIHLSSNALFGKASAQTSTSYDMRSRFPTELTNVGPSRAELLLDILDAILDEDVHVEFLIEELRKELEL